MTRRGTPVSNGPNSVNETNRRKPPNRHNPTSIAGRRPLRVLLMIGSMDGGGSEQQTLLLLRHLDRARFAPELYLLRRQGSLLGEVPADVPIHAFDGLPQARWNWPGKIHRAQVAHVAAVLADRRIDVIYDRTFHMSLIAGPAAAGVGIPRVATIVSPPSRAVPLNAGRFLSFKRRQLRAAYLGAAAVVGVSRPVAADAAAYYRIARRRIQVIPNPVDAESLDRIVASGPVPPRERRYTIACVGRLSREKGQAELLTALSQLAKHRPEFELPDVWMIGQGPLAADLRASAGSLGLSERVRFLGHRDQPAHWIAAADAVCLPSHFEGFPNVMLEAMALGTPVIARSIAVVRSLGSIPSNHEYRGKDYLASFGSTPGRPGVDLARKIRRLWLNPTATHSRVIAARGLAREALAIRAIVPRIEQTLIAAVERHGSVAGGDQDPKRGWQNDDRG